MYPVGLLADVSALNPREKWDSKKFECYGRLVKLLLPFARKACMHCT
jgi:hypothetical protein